MTRIVFVKIENRVSAANTFQRKSFNQFFARKNLLAIRRRPAEQRQKISKGGGNEPSITIRCQRNNFAVLAFGKLRFVRRQDQREVRELRYPRAEGLVEQNLFVCVGEVI